MPFIFKSNSEFLTKLRTKISWVFLLTHPVDILQRLWLQQYWPSVANYALLPCCHGYRPVYEWETTL